MCIIWIVQTNVLGTRRIRMLDENGKDDFMNRGGYCSVQKELNLSKKVG